MTRTFSKTVPFIVAALMFAALYVSVQTVPADEAKLPEVGILG